MEEEINNFYKNRQFMVFNLSEISKIDFSKILETSEETLRVTLDKQKTFVKWDGDEIPNFFNDMETKEGPFNYDEIIEIINGDEWVDNEIMY
jgi:hypothetical protein